MIRNAQFLAVWHRTHTNTHWQFYSKKMQRTLAHTYIKQRILCTRHHYINGDGWIPNSLVCYRENPFKFSFISYFSFIFRIKLLVCLFRTTNTHEKTHPSFSCMIFCLFLCFFYSCLSLYADERRIDGNRETVEYNNCELAMDYHRNMYELSNMKNCWW